MSEQNTDRVPCPADDYGLCAPPHCDGTQPVSAAYSAPEAAPPMLTEREVVDAWWHASRDDWAVPIEVMVRFARQIGATVVDAPEVDRG